LSARLDISLTNKLLTAEPIRAILYISMGEI